MFRLEIPSYGRKEEAIEYIEEFIEHNSEINGTGRLDSYVDRYDEWIDKLGITREIVPSEAAVPSETYFMIREADDRIVGMCNIRLGENRKILSAAGHIGYSIRPTERRKGYAKKLLYLALQKCREVGIKDALLFCDSDNIASEKTILSIGGKLQREWFEDVYYFCDLKMYSIDTEKALQDFNSIIK